MLAATHPEDIILVVDMDAQANTSEMLLTCVPENKVKTGPNNTEVFPERTTGKTVVQELEIESESIESRRPAFEGRSNFSPTVLGYMMSAYEAVNNPLQGLPPSVFITRVHDKNPNMPPNLYLMCGDTRLDYLGSSLDRKMLENPTMGTFPFKELGRSLHTFADALAKEMKKPLHMIVDTNPAMTPFTQISLLSTEKLIMPVSADDFSFGAIYRTLPLLYGRNLRLSEPLEYFKDNMFAARVQKYNLNIAKIHLIINNSAHMRNDDSVKSCQGAADSIGKMLFEEFCALNTDQPNELDRIFSLRNRLGISRDLILQLATEPDRDAALQRFTDVFASYVRNFRSAGVAASRTGLPMWRLKRYIKQVHCFTQVPRIDVASSQRIVADFIGFPLDNQNLIRALDHIPPDEREDYTQARAVGILQRIVGGGVPDDLRMYLLRATSASRNNILSMYTARHPCPPAMTWDFNARGQ